MLNARTFRNPFPTPHWEFIQGEDFQWRAYSSANGESPLVSEPFADFGRCVSDAIRHGFRADLHACSTRSNGKGSSTHTIWSQGAAS
jgi:hypothetical protein